VRLLNAIGDWLDKESLKGGDFCRSVGKFLQAEFPELVDRESVRSIALQSAQQYVRAISRTELESILLGRDLLDELSRYPVQMVDRNYPLRHPYFWGAWICQGV
jgi:CHAT domain-containing protein